MNPKEEKRCIALASYGSPSRVVAVVAAALLVVAGVAYATIPDSGGVIHGCYSKSGGSLRVIDASVTNCSKSETALDGTFRASRVRRAHRDRRPAGPAGTARSCRPQGPAGPPGPSGLSHGYLASTSNVPISQAPAFSDVDCLRRPDGNYMVSAQIGAVDSGGSNPDIRCRVSVNGSVLSGTEVGPRGRTPRPRSRSSPRPR